VAGRGVAEATSVPAAASGARRTRTQTTREMIRPASPAASGEAQPLAPRLERAFAAIVAVLAVAIAAGHLIAAFAPRGGLWGVDALAFLPSPATWLVLAAVLAATLLLARRPAGGAAGATTTLPAAVRATAWIAGLGVAAALFWRLRIRHVLLGDGIPLTAQLPDVHALHPREPLAMLVQHGLYDLLAPLFAGPGVARSAVVADCVAVGSVVAGVAFAAVAVALGREIARSLPSRDGTGDRAPAALLAVALFAQGYAQLFFGYVENYAMPVVVVALFLLAGLRFLRGAGSILPALGAAALAVALDFTTVAIGPAVLVLVAAGLLDRGRRAAVLRDTLGAAAASAAVLAWLQLGPAHYPAVPNLLAMLASGRAGHGYLLSADHLRDFANEQALVGPFGFFLFVPAAVAVSLAWRRRRPEGRDLFLLAAGAGTALACWVAADLPLGYARDWDLFAPLSLAMTVAGLALTAAVVRAPASRRLAFVAIAAVSILHTAPWVALNTSPQRSLARFATLPIDGGRRETTIAWWYADRGEFAEAKRWLGRAISIEPRNNRAVDLLGRIAFEEGDRAGALRAYLVAFTLRPDKEAYLEQLARAVAAVGGPDSALVRVDGLLDGNPENGGLWLERAMLQHAAGRPKEARVDRERALRLWPDLAGFPDRLPRLTDS